MQTELSIIIVNYNGGKLVVPCIASLYKNPPKTSFEIIFIDNASTDGSAEQVAALYPAVRCVRNPANLGLARAFNQGLSMAAGHYLLCLDNDTRVLPEALSTMLTYLASHQAVGAVGARLFNPDMSPQKTARRAPGACNAIFGRRSLVTRLWPDNKISQRYLMEEYLDSNEPYQVDWVSTAALMVRRDVVTEVGGLDEAFFVYWVDADWCARIRAAGWQIHALPAARVIHDENLKGRRRTRRSSRMIIDFHRGAYRYYRKNHTGSIWHPMSLVALVGLAGRAAILIAWDSLRFGLVSARKKAGAETEKKHRNQA